MFGWSSAVSYVNGRIMAADGEARSIRVRRRILAIDAAPEPGDVVVDLDGRFVVPGLINAHDHLELNHYGRLRPRAAYGNAREWIADLGPLVKGDAAIIAKSRVALADRLFIGGLKNILSGVTTVAHHNPLYRALGFGFPVRVVDRFGWAHSLGLQHGPAGAHGEPGGIVGERYAATPRGQAFIVHAAEGVDAQAAREVDELERCGVLGENAVLVHGLAIAPPEWHALFARGVSLVWCPASNQYLFGRTLAMSSILSSPASAGRVALGTDSRVTGSMDLLEELRVAASTGVDADVLMRMVTSWAADLLRLGDEGRIRVGAPADLTIVPPVADSAAASLLGCKRADIALVVRRGTPVVGDTSLRVAFTGRRIPVKEVEIDGRVRLMQAELARRIGRCLIAEAGVRVPCAS